MTFASPYDLLFFGQLSIDGACPGMTLRRGNLYVVLEEDEQLADLLLWGTLIDMCDAGVSACVVSPSPVASMKRSGLATRALAAQASGRLAIFSLDNHAESVSGIDRMIEDLQYWRSDDKRLLVIDGAEKWFPQAACAGLRELHEWATGREAAVILLLRATGATGTDMAVELLPYAQMFSGMAGIKSRYGSTTWDIFHWFGPSGLMAKMSYPLRRTESHRLEVPVDEAVQASIEEPAADELKVIAQRSAFLSKEMPVAAWRLVEDHDALLAETGNAVAATVVLSFTPGTDYVELARCVFNLRKRYGTRLKIVVREVNSRLRCNQEALIVRVGANLIVPAEISYARFLSLVAMVQGLVFPRQLPATFELALRQAMPEEEQGYLKPHEFSRALASASERSRILGVQNALLRLHLAYGLLPIDVLRYCNIQRAGDLVTADDRSIYLFLYACRESEIDKALERLFGLPVAELFSTEDRFLSAHLIRQAIADFDVRNRQHAFPDLSAECAVLLAEPRRTAQDAPAMMTAKQGQPQQRYEAPPPAVRRPLFVKGAPTLTNISIQSS